MAFDARQELATAEAEYTPFPFTDLEGVERELPNPYMLNPAELRADLGLEADADIDDVPPDQLIAVLLPDEWAAIWAMPPMVQKRLIEAWLEHCGLELDDEGKELSRSSDPGRTSKPSKPTSRSGASTSGRKGSTKSAVA